MKKITKFVLFTLAVIFATSCSADRLKPIRALARSQNLDKKEEAMDCYAKLIDEYPSSVYVAQSRNAYRRIRN